MPFTRLTMRFRKKLFVIVAAVAVLVSLIVVPVAGAERPPPAKVMAYCGHDRWYDNPAWWPFVVGFFSQRTAYWGSQLLHFHTYNYWSYSVSPAAFLFRQEKIC